MHQLSHKAFLLTCLEFTVNVRFLLALNDLISVYDRKFRKSPSVDALETAEVSEFNICTRFVACYTIRPSTTRGGPFLES